HRHHRAAHGVRRHASLAPQAGSRRSPWNGHDLARRGGRAHSAGHARRARRTDCMRPSIARLLPIPLVLTLATTSGACRKRNDNGVPRVTGYVEATDVRVAPEVGGRVLEIGFKEGDRIATGAMLAKIDTRETEIAIQRATADRQQMDAQLRLLKA